MYINRNIEKTIENVNKTFPVLLITGPRQVGKTTMLKKLASDDRQYVTLDDPMIREMAVNEPALFLQRYVPPVIIDEIQYAPGLLTYIKMYVDEKKQNGLFWLTGSQMFHMMKHASESLAGRVGILHLLGLSNAEVLGKTSEHFIIDKDKLLQEVKTLKSQTLTEVYQTIFKGGMPVLYTEDTNTDIFFASYMQTYLQRDIRDITQVGDELAFFRFITCVAARTAQMLNYAEIAKEVGISAPTAKQWLSILVSSGIVYLLEPYYNNALKRIVKTPKLYFLDTGLCTYLTKWGTPETLEAGAMSGAIFETWVVSEIIKSYYNEGKRPPLYYYRDKDMKEIDVIIYENGTVYPVEIKKSGNPGKDAIKNFGVLEANGLKVGIGAVICMTQDLIPIDKNNWYVPVWLI
ncbi:MAG TPA: ATPase [Clostridiales bacterium]|nr:MAG: ATPase [Clostridiales bacterium GWD2_32_59]HAN09636.1 ATPase [Clostridiales bacterium]